MELDSVINFQLKRANAFAGLMIDVDTWQDAHNYHRDQQKLHVLAFHKTGILGGLEVVANNPPDLSLTIQPGMAVDSDGNNIIVADAQRYTLQTRQKGTIYLVIQFREVPAGPYQPPDGGQPTRIVEAYRIQERESLPAEAYLELARIDFDPANSAIHNPRTPGNPGSNELDYRHRQVSDVSEFVGPVRPAVKPPPVAEPVKTQTPPPPPPSIPAASPEPARAITTSAPVAIPQEKIMVGYFSLVEGSRSLHRAGLDSLCREIERQYNFSLSVRDVVALNTDLKQCKLLYLVGTGSFQLGEPEHKALDDFIKSGGTILGEGCADSLGEPNIRGAKEFGLAFNQLASKLGFRLENVQRGHPLLASVHLFTGAPQGAEAGMLLAGGHMIYSGSDYGCAWNGGHQDNPLGRDVIRGAIEMGANIAVFAQTE